MNSNDQQAITDQCPIIASPLVLGCYPTMKGMYEEYNKLAYITLFCLLGLELTNLVCGVLASCGCCGIYKNEEDTLMQVWI